MNFSCPHCQGLLEVIDGDVGDGECPLCHNSFTLPSLGLLPAEPKKMEAIAPNTWLPNQQNQPASCQESKSQPASMSTGCMLIVALVWSLILFGCISTCQRNAKDRDDAIASQPKSVESQETDARSMAKVLIRKQLKAPSSAEFFNVKSKFVGNGEFIVAGEVEAINSFNAKLRQKFACTLIRSPEDRWALTNLDFER